MAPFWSQRPSGTSQDHTTTTTNPCCIHRSSTTGRSNHPSSLTEVVDLAANEPAAKSKLASAKPKPKPKNTNVENITPLTFQYFLNPLAKPMETPPPSISLPLPVPSKSIKPPTPKLLIPLQVGVGAQIHLQDLKHGTQHQFWYLEEALWRLHPPSPLHLYPVVPSYCNPESWPRCVPDVPPEYSQYAVRWYPTHIGYLSTHYHNKFRNCLLMSNVVAVGEVGLDFKQEWCPETQSIQQELL